MNPQREIEDLIARFYAAFDNRQGRGIGVDELRRMFLTDARITRVLAGQVDTWTVEEFIAPRAAMLTDGTLVAFHEWESDGETIIFENIAAHRSQYRKYGRLHGAPYTGEGRKFISLCRLEGRWRIVSVLWEEGDEGAEGGE
ncbi:MAG: hypothetical protein JOZ12_16380 [Sinobacteraceae bacterium]|nr:hypothetical protein [Nevskiaceae bacterium]